MLAAPSSIFRSWQPYPRKRNHTQTAINSMSVEAAPYVIGNTTTAYRWLERSLPELQSLGSNSPRNRFRLEMQTAHSRCWSDRIGSRRRASDFLGGSPTRHSPWTDPTKCDRILCDTWQGKELRVARKRVSKYPLSFRQMATERMKDCPIVSALAAELGVHPIWL